MPTPTYDPADSHLLSDTARALHPETQNAHALTAEQLLGFRGVTFTGTDADDAVLAVVHQVNFQVARPQMFGIIAGESKGDQSVQYRTLGGGTGTLLDPIASEIAGRLLGAQTGGWDSMRNAR